MCGNKIWCSNQSESTNNLKIYILFFAFFVIFFRKPKVKELSVATRATHLKENFHGVFLDTFSTPRAIITSNDFTYNIF